MTRETGERKKRKKKIYENIIENEQRRFETPKMKKKRRKGKPKHTHTRQPNSHPK
jgi:hypothetical protein